MYSVIYQRLVDCVISSSSAQGIFQGHPVLCTVLAILYSGCVLFKLMGCFWYLSDTRPPYGWQLMWARRIFTRPCHPYLLCFVLAGQFWYCTIVLYYGHFVCCSNYYLHYTHNGALFGTIAHFGTGYDLYVTMYI